MCAHWASTTCVHAECLSMHAFVHTRRGECIACVCAGERVHAHWEHPLHAYVCTHCLRCAYALGEWRTCIHCAEPFACVCAAVCMRMCSRVHCGKACVCTLLGTTVSAYMCMPAPGCVLTCRYVQSVLGEVGVCAVCTDRCVHKYVFGGGGCVYLHCQSVCEHKGVFQVSCKC